MKWNINEKLVATVTDNAANIIKAVDLLESSSLRCAAHTLQLCIKDCLANTTIESILSKCRSIVGHFKRSLKATANITSIQNQLNIKNHKLINEVSTRWNSTYYMIERLYEHCIALSTFFSDEVDIEI